MSAFERLPSEILLKIMDLIDRLHDSKRDGGRNTKDLANLRLTCRRLANAAAEALFYRIPVWLDKDSLHRLLDCSKHPLISKYVNQLDIGPERVSPYKWRQETNLVWEKVSRSSKLPVTMEQLHEAATECKAAVERLDYQKRMEIESLDIALLSDAFRSFPNLVVFVFEYTNLLLDSWDLMKTGLVFYESDIPWRVHVFHVILQSLAKAGCKPREIIWENIEPRLNSDMNVLPIWAFNDIELLINTKQMAQLLFDLRVLRIEKTWRNLEISSTDDFDELLPNRSLGRFIDFCPQLEKYKLNLGHPYTGLKCENLMGLSSSRCLRELIFGELEIDIIQLAACVNSESLRSVVLHRVTLVSGHWVAFLDMLRTEHPRNLQTFELRGVLTCSEEACAFTDEEYYGEWGWDHDQRHLVEYIQGKTDINPYYVWHRDLFPWLEKDVPESSNE